MRLGDGVFKLIGLVLGVATLSSFTLASENTNGSLNARVLSASTGTESAATRAALSTDPTRKSTAKRERKTPPNSLAPRDRLIAQRKLEAARVASQQGARAAKTSPVFSSAAAATNAISAPSRTPLPMSLSPASAANGRTAGVASDTFPAHTSRRRTAPSMVFSEPNRTHTSLLQNLSEPPAPFEIEMGDRPGRGTSACSEGKVRRFGDLDSRTLAQALPEFTSLRARNVCMRRRSLIADYAFR